MALSHRVLQPTLQVAIAVLLTSLLTFIRPLNFSLACLSAVFVLVLHILLVQNFHVGTQLLSAASFLGTVWSGIAAAGIVVSITMQIPSRAGHIALLVILASGGLALGCLVRVSIRQFPLLFLQGTNLLMTFGMSVVLSFWAPTVRVLWSSYLSHMLLAFLAAGLASIVVGLLVLPSLATAEAMRNVITALNRAGQTSTMCVSILLAPLHLLGASKPGDPMQQQHQQQHKDQDIHPAGADTDTDAAALRHDRLYLQQEVQQPSRPHALLPNMTQPFQEPQQQQQQGPRTLQQQPSLLLEDPLSHGALSSIVEQANQPGQWGLRSFLAANSAAASAARAAAGAQDTKDTAELNTRGAAPTAVPAAGDVRSGVGSGSVLPAAPAAGTAAGIGAGSPTASGSAAAPAADDEDLWWGNDHYDEDHTSDIISADANVQVNSMPGAYGHSISGIRHTSESSSSSSSGGGSSGPQPLQLATLAVGPAPGLTHLSVRHPSGSRHSSNLHLPVSQLHPSSSAPSLNKHSNINFRSNSASAHPGPMQGRKGILPAISSRSSPNLNALSLRMPLRPFTGLRKHSSTAPTTAGVAGKGGKGGTASRSAAAELQRHPLVRLQRGVDQIRPLLQATRQLQAAVTVEQAWWVGMLVRYRPGKIVDAGAWQQLVDALEALVHRVAALESMLEGGHEHSSLAQLTSYQALAATCGAVFAQAAALCGVVSTHLSTKLQQTDQQGDLLYALQQVMKGICGSRNTTTSSRGTGGSGAGPAVLPGHGTTTSYAAVVPGSAAHGPAESSSRVASRTAVQVGTLRQTYAPPVPSSHLPSSATVQSISSSSSAPPKHSPSSPSLCSASTFDWDLAKQHLVQVLEYETHQYYTALVQAAHDRPFKLDPARSMTALMFLCMLSMGVIEACQKLQSTAQALLGCAGDGSALGKEPGQQQQAVHMGRKPQAAATAHARAPKAPPAAAAGPSGTLLLLRTFLIVDVMLRVQDAFINQLPAACKSREAFKAQLKDRRFQAGFKAWLGSTIALVVIAAAYTQVTFLGTKGPSVFMFGFMSLVFTMRERVESSMEMVIFRVGATVVGACLGHLVMFNPATAYNPYIIGALNIFFALVFVPFSLGQFRLVVVLGLLTFASVTLCQYIGCCGGVGSVTYLVGRILATGGGALFAMLLNRMLWPWRRNRWAMEELSRALSIAVVSARMMYAAEYNQVAATAPSGPTAATTKGTHSSNTSGVTAATGTVQRAASTPAAVVIELPVSSYGSNPSTAHQQGQTPVPSPAAAQSAMPAASFDVPPALVGKTPEQLQQMLAGIMMPVQISIARDTWVTWKKGALALTPSVPLMLLAVQQMVDALSALGITYKLLSTMDQPSSIARSTISTPGHTGTSSSNADISSSSGASASAEECVQWQRQLLLEELVQPIHGSFCRLLQELGTLVGLVLAHVRAPSDAGRTALLSKIQEVHDMRVSVSLEYIHLRNQRHRKMRQQLAAIWNSQHEHHAPGCAHAAHGMQAPHQQRNFMPATSARYPPAAVAGPQAAASAAKSGDGSAAGTGAVGQGCAAVVDGDCWCVQQPGFQHQVLSTVQYMAFVHALRRFFDRAVAVARVAADAQF